MVHTCWSSSSVAEGELLAEGRFARTPAWGTKTGVTFETGGWVNSQATGERDNLRGHLALRLCWVPLASAPPLRVAGADVVGTFLKGNKFTLSLSQTVLHFVFKYK